jgi:hypothetical protein
MLTIDHNTLPLITLMLIITAYVITMELLKNDEETKK